MEIFYLCLKPRQQFLLLYFKINVMTLNMHILKSEILYFQAQWLTDGQMLR